MWADNCGSPVLKVWTNISTRILLLRPLLFYPWNVSFSLTDSEWTYWMVRILLSLRWSSSHLFHCCSLLWIWCCLSLHQAIRGVQMGKRGKEREREENFFAKWRGDFSVLKNSSGAPSRQRVLICDMLFWNFGLKSWGSTVLWTNTFCLCLILSHWVWGAPLSP